MKTFGKTKMSKPDVRQRIRQIVERYDVLHAQEIRDSSEESVHELIADLNAGIPTEASFDVIISPPIGRTTYKEQYAYIYKKDRVAVYDSYVYDDTAHDVFEREPYSALIGPISNSSDKFALIGLHAKPADAVAEIGFLKDVITDVKTKFGSGVETLVVGDLNADCSYATYNKRVQAGDYLTTNFSYVWLIGENADTTVRESTDCAYDRLVVPSTIASRVVSGSAVSFDFGEWLGINEDTSLDVSDHYPVEMKLRV
nr:hypothetical protein BaRGS_026142 [Batillaria attramentaria]